jgi:hypothetical protein
VSIVHRSHVIGARAGQCDRCLASIKEKAILVRCPYAPATIPGMAKRGYSKDFTPHGDTGKAYLLDQIPAGLWAAVRAKCKRQGVSVRALILKLLTEWLHDAP